jgi:hypothetical protein
LIFNRHFCEVWNADHINTIISEIATRNGSRLDSLIDCASANRLNLSAIVFAHDASDCACYSG